MRSSIFGVLIATSIAACSGPRHTAILPPPEGFPHHTADEVVSRLPTPDSLWSTFAGDLAIAYSVPGDRGTLNARVTYRRADSVLIRFRAPLGIEVSRALITPDSMFVYDRVKKVLYAGDRQATEVMLPAAFRSSDIAAALFGFDQVPRGSWAIRADSTTYALTSEDGLRSMQVDPARWRIIAADERDPQGMIVEQRRFADFERIDGRYLPRRIVTSRPGEDSRASVRIRRLSPNPDRLSFDLGLRSDVERIPVY